MAVRKAQEYIKEVYRWVVEIDLSKFFDRVNHDILMSRVAKVVEDKAILKLIRRYLNARIMENGLVKPRSEGVPQGGPLSPLLSNIMLTELDRELEKRGHKFCRYADDCNIYVKSEEAAKRVLRNTWKEGSSYGLTVIRAVPFVRTSQSFLGTHSTDTTPHVLSWRRNQLNG